MKKRIVTGLCALIVLSLAFTGAAFGDWNELAQKSTIEEILKEANCGWDSRQGICPLKWRTKKANSSDSTLT